MKTLDLGITQEELREQVIARAAERLVEYYTAEDHATHTIRRTVHEAIAAVAQKVADETVTPIVAGKIEEVVLQRTNEWGESQGQPMTFRQYLVHCAENWIKEPVDFEGKTRAESRDSYRGFRPCGTRIAYLIDKHLQYSIENAMKDALKNANSAIVGGIEDAVKIKLREVSEALKVQVGTGAR